jgi:hypothetical protein
MQRNANDFTAPERRMRGPQVPVSRIKRGENRISGSLGMRVAPRRQQDNNNEVRNGYHDRHDTVKSATNRN